MDETKSRPRARKAAEKAVAKTATKKPAAEKAAPARRPRKATPAAPADHETRVRIAAYLRAERRGFTPGYEIEDWLAAEAEVGGAEPARPAAMRRKTPARKPRTG